jgi:hypothetical protein
MFIRQVALLAVTLFLPSASAQITDRAFVGFEKFFYEVPASEPHIKMFFICSQQPDYDIEVSYETLDGTALAGRDYVQTQGSFLFPAGSPTRTREIQVQILPRESVEDRTFRVKLSATFPGDVSRSRGEVDVTITDIPRLSTAMHWQRTNVVLGWRTSATNFVLETSSSVSNATWSPVKQKPEPIKDSPRQNLLLPNDKPTQFFRLRKVSGN